MRRIGRWVLSGLLVAMPVLGLLAVPSAEAASAGNISCVFQTATSSTGTGTVCSVAGSTLLTVQFGGTVGTVIMQGTVDGTNYASLLCVGVPSLSYIGTVSSASILWCSIKGYQLVRANITGAGTNTTVSGMALVDASLATFF